MLKKFQTKDGEITIEITEDGKATYMVGKKKTTFDLSKCESFTYWFEAEREKFVITEDMLTGTEEIEPWMWLVISRGEDRLEYNNDQAESRSHQSYAGLNDKSKTLLSDKDALDEVLSNLDKEALKKAIRSLEPQQQELLIDLYYRDIPIVEIAERRVVSEAAIRGQRNRALKRIKKLLL